jgi:hypothetical protein
MQEKLGTNNEEASPQTPPQPVRKAVSGVRRVVSVKKVTPSTSRGPATLETASPNHPRDPNNPTKPLVITPPMPVREESHVEEVHIDDGLEAMKKKDLTCCICNTKSKWLAVETVEGTICPTCIGLAAIRTLRRNQ